MTFPIDVDDDGTPRAALDVAGQGVRAFNHRSGERHPGREGWQYPSDAYRSLGELTFLTGALPEVFQHIMSALRHQLDEGHIAIDYGSKYWATPRPRSRPPASRWRRRRKPRTRCTTGWPMRRTRSTRPATADPISTAGQSDVATADYYGPRGPYGTESEATAESGQRDWPAGEQQQRNLDRLLAATAGADVRIGSYDRRVLAWLAGWEPQTVEAIAALIERAASGPEQ